MKNNSKLTLTLFLILLTPSFYLSSCGNYSPNLSKIVSLVKNNFDKNPEEIEIAKVSDVNEAINNFKTILNNEQKENEIFYSQFNFLGKKSLTINSKQILPNNQSIIDWFEQGKCNLFFSDNYVIQINDFVNTNNYFSYAFNGWLTVQFIVDFNEGNVNIKKGDFLQFIYNIRSNYYSQISIDEKGYTNLIFSNIKPTINSLETVYGFIEWTINGDAMSTLAINNLNDVNYSNHILNCGHYIFNKN